MKGIHPGLILERKLEEKKMKKEQLALLVQEYPQTLTSITKGSRDMNAPLALKLEQALGLEEGYFMTLQMFYDIKQEKAKKLQDTPDLTKIRTALFWDTNLRSIDWERQFRSVILRVLERGNQDEIDEISRFYGMKKVKAVELSITKK